MSIVGCVLMTTLMTCRWHPAADADMPYLPYVQYIVRARAPIGARELVLRAPRRRRGGHEGGLPLPTRVADLIVSVDVSATYRLCRDRLGQERCTAFLSTRTSLLRSGPFSR